MDNCEKVELALNENNFIKKYLLGKVTDLKDDAKGFDAEGLDTKIITKLNQLKR